jgi:hypothetical protein
MFSVVMANTLSEATFADHLDALLSEPRLDVAFIDLSTTDAAFLAEYSGAAPASEAGLERLDARSAARVAAEVARTLSRGNVAALLGVDPSPPDHIRSPSGHS